MTGVAIPRLQTERTIMREWRGQDLETFAATAAEAEVTRLPGGALNRAQAWRTMALCAGH